MTTASDVIAALNQRHLLKTGRAEAPEALPSGWQGWLDAMSQAEIKPRHAPPQAWIETFVQRPPQRIGKTEGLGRPFFQLLRLGRPTNPREDRGLRIGAGALDLLLHLVLAALLLWLMYLRFLALGQQQDEESAETVQVEFIGRGNAQEGGGALASAGAESAPASAAPSRKPSPNPASAGAAAESAHPTLEQVPMPAAVPMAASSDAPTLEPARPLPTEAAAAQQLQVSNVPQPQPEHFQLPPPRERSVLLPEVRLRDAQPQPQVEQIATLQAQPVRALQVKPREAQLRAPELKTQVEAIETFVPDAALLSRQRALPAAGAQQAQIKVPQLRGQVAEIALRAGDGGATAAQPGNGSAATGHAAAPGAGGNKASPAGDGLSQAGKGAGARAADAGGRGVSAAGAGAGPGLKAAPGGWPGAAKSDDWGASSRNVAGSGNGNGRNGDGKSGLFNADGSPRLPDQWTKNSGVDIDRAGTWFKRPGLEYRGTRFDKYWIPSGNLLEEWVRKGIKEVSIPIPGTKLHLQCVISLLSFGGGCLPVNPDANEQPSTGRKAPEIPFKPELQEDNGSVRTPPATTPTPPATGG